MNYKDDGGCCYFHPREYVIGVCALCLNERLLVLASRQTHLHKAKYNVTPKRTLQKIFALTSLVNRVDIKPQKSEFQHSSSTSQEDSFISIKFEGNGAASWDKDKISKTKVPVDKQYNEMSMNGKKINSVVEHAKPRGVLRWRKRIGHLFQLMRWKRSSKGKMCHVGTKLEGAKVKQGWIRTLTKRRTKS